MGQGRVQKLFLIEFNSFFSMFSSHVTFDVDLILGLFFNFWDSNALILGSG